MVEKYREIIEELQHMDVVRLFAVAKMDDLTDRWALIFGIEDHTDFEYRKDLFRDIIDIIRKHLPSEDFQDIARGTLQSIDEHLIQDLLKYPVGQEIKDIRANGNFIHEGYILIAKSNTNVSLDV